MDLGGVVGVDIQLVAAERVTGCGHGGCGCSWTSRGRFGGGLGCRRRRRRRREGGGRRGGSRDTLSVV